MNYSFLMTIYSKDNAKHLDIAILSMVNQTLQAYEIILIVDGLISIEIQKVISKHLLSSKNIFVYYLPENLGLGLALDFGISKCNTDYIARMDSDDISINNRIEIQAKYLEIDPEISIIGSYVSEFEVDPSKIHSIRTVPLTLNKIKDYFKQRSPFNHPTVVLKKSDVIKAGGFGKLRRKQDYDLFSRMILLNMKAINIGISLVYFRSDINSIKRKKSWDNIKSYIKVQYKILTRKQCNVIDFIFVSAYQLFVFILPLFVYKILYFRFLRKSRYFFEKNS